MEITAKEHQSYKLSCKQAIEDTTWPETDCPSPVITLAQALHLAKNGQNLSKDNVEKLEPKTMLFHEWMDYAHIVTICYNKCHQKKKYTILRIGCS